MSGFNRAVIYPNTFIYALQRFVHADNCKICIVMVSVNLFSDEFQLNATRE